MAPATATTVVTSRPTFPIYLFPSFKIPFRRRQTGSSISSAASNDSSIPSLSSSPSSSVATTPNGSPPLPTYFDVMAMSPTKAAPLTERLARTNPDTLRCSSCSADVGFASQIVSKGFTGRYGRAYLVSPPPDAEDKPTMRDLVNIKVGKPENRQLVTGWHVVADIQCVVCTNKLGWKYVDAKEQSQKYKVGKFILETERVVSYRSWEDILVPKMEGMEAKTKKNGNSKYDEVVFDSDDEDECEDIFAGTWDPEVVAKRRSRKVNVKRKQSSE